MRYIKVVFLLVVPVLIAISVFFITVSVLNNDRYAKDIAVDLLEKPQESEDPSSYRRPVPQREDKAGAASTSEQSRFAEDIPLENGKSWEKFEQTVLGLSFYYPPEWGKPYTEPTRSLTDLQEIHKRYEGTDNTYEQALRISFPDSDVSILLMNGRSDYRHPIDPYLSSIELLDKTENVCDLYKLSYLKHHYRKCENNVYTVLMSEEADNINYNRLYRLKSYGLIKLSNGFYDTAIAVDKTGWQTFKYGSNAPTMSYEDFMIALEADTGIYEKQAVQFARFVNSFNAFQPKEPQTILNTIKPDDSEAEITIKNYYNHIIKGELSEAYDMYEIKNTGFDEYTNWYKSTIMALVKEIESLQDNNYRLMLSYQDNNSPIQSYRVKMKVNEGKIRTMSSEEITSEELFYNGLAAFTKNVQGKNYVVLSKNGEEIIIEEANDDFMENLPNTLNFNDLRFSANGNYLLYTAQGWEWSFGRVYDIKREEFMLFNELQTPYEFGVSKNEQYLFACSVNDMTGIYYATIYELPGLRKLFDLDDHISENEFIYPQCDHDEINDNLAVVAKCAPWMDSDECISEKEYNIDLSSGAILKK